MSRDIWRDCSGGCDPKRMVGDHRGARGRSGAGIAGGFVFRCGGHGHAHAGDGRRCPAGPRAGGASAGGSNCPLRERGTCRSFRAAPVAHQFLAQPCDAEILRVAIERACHLQAVLQDESIRRTVSRSQRTFRPSRAPTGVDVGSGGAGGSLSTVAQIIEQDVGISAKVLQLVNSAFFELSTSVTSIRDAVSFIGVATLKTLVLSVEMFGAFIPPGPSPGFSLEGLQRHAQPYFVYRRPPPGAETSLDIPIMAAACSMTWGN